MEISVYHGGVERESAPLAVLPLWEGEALSSEIAALLEADDFQGKFKQSALIYPRAALPARRLLLLGLGRRATMTSDTVRQVGALAAQKAHELQLTGFASNVPTTDAVPAATAAQALVEGALAGLYRFLEHKSDRTPEQTHQVTHLRLFVADADDVPSVQAGVDRGLAVAHGVTLARDLANGPGNIVTPAYLGDVAQTLGARFGMQVTVLGPEELAQQGFGGLLAVGKGSAQSPRFIILEHGSATAQHPPICLVGKGITFDTGGISIKPSENLDQMKMDMSGAAAVLGAMHAVGELDLPLHVVALISAAENMPSGTAYKPGDIITTLSGKTVEVLNTDAEGRIVLADALFYARRYEPQAIVDLATLTGAMMVALGPHAIGLFSNNQPLADRVLRAGQTSAERAWQFPLWDEYHEMMQSTIADLKNVAGRYGGAILAAAFLAAFVGDYPWVHLDIAGTAWTDKPSRAYLTPGATGVGVRLLTQMLQDFCVAQS